MKKLRTIITMLLVLAMVFSSIAVFADESSVTGSVDATTTFSDVPKGSKVEEAVSKLVAYKTISGYPDGTFKPDGEITRAEFAAVISRFKGIAQNLQADAVTGFSDLDNDVQNAWARPYVKAAVDAKIINGFEDGTFRASEPVTYEQAIKMIICAIGYEVVAKSEYNKLLASTPNTVTWSSGYVAAANKNNITLGALMANVSAPATRGTVAILTSNAYEAPKLNAESNANGVINYGKDDSTIGESQYNTKEEIVGTITATYYTGISEQAPDLQLNQIRIKSSSEEKVYDLSDSLRKIVDLEDLVGKRVTATYAKDEYAIVAIKEKSNSTSRIYEQNIVRPISGAVIKFTDDTGRISSVSLSGYTFLYNGKYDPSFNVSSLDTLLQNGYIDVIENTNIAKVTSFKVGVVKSYDKTNNKINFKYDEPSYDVPVATINKPLVWLNGKLTEFDSVNFQQYDVINLMETPASYPGNKIKKMYVTRGTNSATVYSENDVDREVDLEGKTFYLTNQYNNFSGNSTDEKAPFEKDEKYTYYLDCTGQIAAVNYKSATQGTYKYGYVIGEGKDKDDSQYKVRLITSDGTEKIYTLKSTVKVDGEKISDKNVSEKLKASAILANAAYNAAVPSWNSEAVLSGDYCYQPIRYSLSGSYIESIDTVYDNPSDDSSNDTFKCELSLSEGKVSTSTSVIKKGSASFGVNSNTIIFYVPDSRTDSKAYSKMSASKAFAVSANRWVEVFDVDQSSTTKAVKFVIVYEKDPTLNFLPSSPYMVVTGKKIDGESLILTGFKNAETEAKDVKVSTTNYRSTFDVEESNTYIKSVFDATYCSNPDDINVGDFIRYITDSNNEVIGIQRWYNAKNPTQAEVASSFEDAKAKRYYFDTTGEGSDFFVKYGEAIEMNIDEKTLTHTFVGKDEIAGYDHLSNAFVYSCSSTKVYIYDEEYKEKVKYVDSLGSIYDHSTDNPSKIIVVAPSNGSKPTARIIYIIND